MMEGCRGGRRNLHYLCGLQALAGLRPACRGRGRADRPLAGVTHAVTAADGGATMPAAPVIDHVGRRRRAGGVACRPLMLGRTGATARLWR